MGNLRALLCLQGHDRPTAASSQSLRPIIVRPSVCPCRMCVCLYVLWEGVGATTFDQPQKWGSLEVIISSKGGTDLYPVNGVELLWNSSEGNCSVPPVIYLLPYHSLACEIHHRRGGIRQMERPNVEYTPHPHQSAS